MVKDITGKSSRSLIKKALTEGVAEENIDALCKGNAMLKTTLVQCAKQASRNSKSFLKAQYDRLVVRRGANRATVAVAHSMIIAIYHILKYNEPFKDLGVDYYQQFNTEKKISSYLRKLSDLGWQPPISAVV